MALPFYTTWPSDLVPALQFWLPGCQQRRLQVRLGLPTWQSNESDQAVPLALSRSGRCSRHSRPGIMDSHRVTNHSESGTLQSWSSRPMGPDNMTDCEHHDVIWDSSAWHGSRLRLSLWQISSHCWSSAASQRLRLWTWNVKPLVIYPDFPLEFTGFFRGST